MKLPKVFGTNNMANVLTKYVEKKTMDAAIARINLIRKNKDAQIVHRSLWAPK